jgi:hypothetical protein
MTGIASDFIITMKNPNKFLGTAKSASANSKRECVLPGRKTS